MKRVLTFLPILAFFLATGCTPLGEDVVRKADKPSNSVDPSGFTSADQGVEANPVAPLDPSTRMIISTYGQTIRKYSDRYGFDWRLILAVMKQESNFAPDAESRKGAFGLMQIMPVTEEEVARMLEIADLSHPRNNIRGGIFYLRRLYRLFEGAEESDRIKLTLAAYNAGVGRIYDAQEVAAYFNDNPRRWEDVKEALPYLSKRYYTLHRSIWQQDRPRTGWFMNPQETIAYVDAVMNYYDDYRLYLN
jgi:membrane-bound lytic murein transglycosylase F